VSGGDLSLHHSVKQSIYLLSVFGSVFAFLAVRLRGALLRAPFFLGALSACAGALSWAVLSTGAVAGSVLSGLLAFTSAISLP